MEMESLSSLISVGLTHIDTVVKSIGIIWTPLSSTGSTPKLKFVYKNFVESQPSSIKNTSFSFWYEMWASLPLPSLLRIWLGSKPEKKNLVHARLESVCFFIKGNSYILPNPTIQPTHSTALLHSLPTTNVSLSSMKWNPIESFERQCSETLRKV